MSRFIPVLLSLVVALEVGCGPAKKPERPEKEYQTNSLPDGTVMVLGGDTTELRATVRVDYEKRTVAVVKRSFHGNRLDETTVQEYGTPRTNTSCSFYDENTWSCKAADGSGWTLADNVLTELVRGEPLWVYQGSLDLTGYLK